MAIEAKAPSSLEEKMGLFANCDETANLEYDD
jgi:hypothetical protein